MKDQHDLADMHPLLPSVGDPLSALWPDTIDGFQVGGVVPDYGEHFRAEMSDQLLRQDWTNTLHEATSQIPFDTLARRWRDGFQDLRFEL